MASPNSSEMYGEFFGSSLSDCECDQLYLENFLKYRGIERDLFDSKWFDYRFLHPLKATYLFAQAYREAYQYITRIRYDKEKAKHVRGFSGDDFLKLSPRTRVGFVKARQTADRYGVTYAFWCRESMRFAEEMNWINMPQPHQLYGEAITQKVVHAWLNEQRHSLVRADHPTFKLENFSGTSIQLAYHDFLIKQIRDRGASPWIIASFLDNLPESRLLSEFGEEDVSEARELAKVVREL